MKKQLEKLDTESLVVYSQLLHFLKQEPEDEITKGLIRALNRRINSGQNIEPELRS